MPRSIQLEQSSPVLARRAFSAILNTPFHPLLGREAQLSLKDLLPTVGLDLDSPARELWGALSWSDRRQLAFLNPHTTHAADTQATIIRAAVAEEAVRLSRPGFLIFQEGNWHEVKRWALPQIAEALTEAGLNPDQHMPQLRRAGSWRSWITQRERTSPAWRTSFAYPYAASRPLTGVLGGIRVLEA